MGRKRRAPEPDADGFISTGIYRRRVVRPKQTPAERDAAFDALWESAGRPRCTIRGWLAEWRRSLGESLRPHVEAVTLDQWRKRGGRLYPLELGEGPQGYVLKARLSQETADAARDAIDAMSEIAVLEHNIGADDSLVGNLAFVVNAAWKLGRTVERSTIRQFEPLVAAKVASETALHEHNADRQAKSSARRKTLADEAVAAIEEARRKHPRRTEQVIKDRAAEALGITRRALNMRLQNNLGK